MKERLAAIDESFLNGSIGSLRSALEGRNTIGNSTEFWLGFVVALAAAVVYPLTTSSFRVSNTAFLMTFVFLGLSLGIIWGYADIFSFGRSRFSVRPDTYSASSVSISEAPRVL